MLTLSSSPCGTIVAAGSKDQTVSIFSFASEKKKWEQGAVLSEHKCAVTSVAFCPSNEEEVQLVTGGGDGTILVFTKQQNSSTISFDLTVQIHPESFQLNTSGITSMSCNPADNHRVLIGTADQKVRLWDIHSKVVVSTFEDKRSGMQVPCKPVAWHPCGYIFAVGCCNVNCLRILDIEGTEMCELMDRSKRNMLCSDYVFQISWTKCGDRIASCSAHSYIRVWDMSSQRLLVLLEGHTGPVFGTCWNDNYKLASCGEDGVLMVWDAIAVAST